MIARASTCPGAHGTAPARQRSHPVRATSAAPAVARAPIARTPARGDALGRLLTRAVAQRTGGPVLARAWDPANKPPALPEPHDHASLVAAIKDYDELPGSTDAATRMELLAIIEQLARAARESEEPKRVTAVRTVASINKISAPTDQHMKQLVKASDLAERLEGLMDALSKVVTAAANETDVVRYGVQKAATVEAFATGVPKYLNITPEAGGHALATGGKGRYASSIPLEQQYRLTAGDIGGVHVDGAGGVIELLVVSGGHGGVGSTFESAKGAHLEEKWWKAQIQSLVDKKVTAKLIVLDACLTASMVPAFVPALAPGGKIVGYVHSIPQMTMTADMWAKVAGKSAEEIETSIDERLGALVKEHAESRHDTSLGKTIAVAVYRDDTKTLHYDATAVDQSVIDALPLHADKERGEIAAMKRNLVAQKAQAMTGFVPALKVLTGDAVVEGDKVVPASEWGAWYDESFFALTDKSADPMSVGMTVQTVSGEEWEILELDPGVSMKVKKK